MWRSRTLRSSLFHRGQENVFVFLGRANLRLFHFLFSQGAVSALALILFIAGCVMLLSSSSSHEGGRPSPRQLGLLLLLPFVINCGAALIGAYPYGGTRHDSYLAIFAMPAIAVAISRWRPSRYWARHLALRLRWRFAILRCCPRGHTSAREIKKRIDGASGGLSARLGAAGFGCSDGLREWIAAQLLRLRHRHNSLRRADSVFLYCTMLGSMAAHLCFRGYGFLERRHFRRRCKHW